MDRFDPERVILFGSRARGETLKHSDLDPIVVASAFRDVPWLDRAVQILEALAPDDGKVEVLCYTPVEFERKARELGIVRAALEEGIDLLE